MKRVKQAPKHSGAVIALFQISECFGLAPGSLASLRMVDVRNEGSAVPGGAITVAPSILRILPVSRIYGSADFAAVSPTGLRWADQAGELEVAFV